MLKFKVLIVIFTFISTAFGAYAVNGTCPTTCDEIKVYVTKEQVG